MKSSKSELLKLSIPVAMAYIPFGMIFGVLWSRLGYPWYFSAFIGLFVLAGSAQFLLITLLANAAGLWEIFIATVLLNMRHLFYGFSIAPMVKQMPFTKQLYLAYAMTDETYAVMSHTAGRGREFQDNDLLFIAGIHHFYWVAGCTAGALLGQRMKLEFKGLEFVLTALFVVLLIEQVRNLRDKRELLVPLGVGLICIALFPQQMLLSAIPLTIGWMLFMHAQESAQ